MSEKLDLLKQIAHGMCAQFGNNCEIVIHDLRNEKLESSVVYIENGHVSNRKLGDGPSGVVLETLSRDPSRIKDKFSYLTQTEDGRILKSSTMYIREDDGSISYIFSLNYDITALLTIETAISSITGTEHTAKKEKDLDDNKPQTITHNVNELLDKLIEQALALVGKPVALMNKDDKVAVVQYLNNAGAFLITKSGDKIANLLGISKFTLYSYMDAGK